MTLVAGRDRLTTLAVRQGTLRFVSPSEADATFTFDSAEAALAILTGREDPIEAFMASRFRSDGNLPLAFVLLGLFRPGADATPPP